MENCWLLLNLVFYRTPMSYPCCTTILYLQQLREPTTTDHTILNNLLYLSIYIEYMEFKFYAVSLYINQL